MADFLTVFNSRSSLNSIFHYFPIVTADKRVKMTVAEQILIGRDYHGILKNLKVNFVAIEKMVALKNELHVTYKFMFCYSCD